MWKAALAGAVALAMVDSFSISQNGFGITQAAADEIVVTEGTDAQAEVSVRLSENGRAVTSKGADPDTLVASAKAYLGGLNKLIARRQRGSLDVAAEPRIHSTDVG